MKVTKHQKCLSDLEVAHISVRVFNGETSRDIAKELGISGGYLARMIARVKKSGLVRVTVATE